jgi:hypothetical protein
VPGISSCAAPSGASAAKGMYLSSRGRPLRCVGDLFRSSEGMGLLLSDGSGMYLSSRGRPLRCVGDLFRSSEGIVVNALAPILSEVSDGKFDGFCGGRRGCLSCVSIFIAGLNG